MKTTTCILIVCILNFITFIIGSGIIGGDAVNGHQLDGSYFVSSHGIDTEVTETVWKYSYWHVKSLFVTHPLAIISFIILASKSEAKRKKKLNT
jgi:hypothetical protein